MGGVAKDLLAIEYIKEMNQINNKLKEIENMIKEVNKNWEMFKEEQEYRSVIRNNKLFTIAVGAFFTTVGIIIYITL